MPYETGGRADKIGNNYEANYVIYQLLKVIDEKISYIIIEPIGDEEQGIDIWIGDNFGYKEGQQCKGRNGSKEFWDFGSANAKNFFTNWKIHLDRDLHNTVGLVSPLAFTFLEDLTNRARSTNKNSRDFYEFQICKSSLEFQSFFKNICNVFGINPDTEIELIQCMDYLSRIYYHQFPDAHLEEIVLEKIGYLFLGDTKKIYSEMLLWIRDSSVWGKKIDQVMLYDFLTKREIYQRNLKADKRIMPKFEQLNEEYSSSFIPLNNKFIERDEFLKLTKSIDCGESLLIHGKAGSGKSGCTEAIIQHCKINNIAYLALKLDKHVPQKSLEIWSEEIGLPASITNCIHSISANKKAVIVLDQLDALRWTQSHSRDALIVCTQIVKQVSMINQEREHKISIVFVCRTFDFENDNNIKGIFEGNHKNNIKWKKIVIGELDDDTVKDIIGTQYEVLSNKLKEILRIPSNLYIWQQLDPSKDYNECSTTNNLITLWWDQILEKCYAYGLSQKEMNLVKNELIKVCEKLGRICIPVKALAIEKSYFDFLSSNGLLLIHDNKVSFVHQSILDCFLADYMVRRYYSGDDIVEIIGGKEKQTPIRRYQVQMLLQNLLEFDSLEFLCAGESIYSSEEIRYFIKFVFFEVLNQIEVLDDNIKNFIVKNCQDENSIYLNYLIDNVILSKPQYVDVLRKAGILDEWFCNSNRKEDVFKLLISIRDYLDVEYALFIKKYAFNKFEDDNRFSFCFPHDFEKDSDEIFELRMEFYYKYPKIVERFFDLKSMFERCPLRTVRMVAVYLNHKNDNTKNNFRLEEDLFENDFSGNIENPLEIINILLPYLPKENNFSIYKNSWSNRFFQHRNIERVCINILKIANKELIDLNPEFFLDKYREYMGMGVDIYNELILDGLNHLPIKYSDFIIHYLCSDFEHNLFDKTSGNGDELLLAKSIIGKHSITCSIESIKSLEKAVISYIPSDAKELYQRRIDYNKEKNGVSVFWPFWGELQYEILPTLCDEKLDVSTIELMQVLKRRAEHSMVLRYAYSYGHSGTVRSSIAEKKLSDKKWREILNNKTLNKDKHSWREVPDGFVSNGIADFASSFKNAVALEPHRFIKLVMSKSIDTQEIFIDALFEGVSQSDEINEIPKDLLEKMLLEYPINYENYRAHSICRIIERRDDFEWRQEILDILKDIAFNHKNPELDKPKITNDKDTEMHSYDMLITNAINCVRGEVSQAIAKLLKNKNSYFSQYKETIINLTQDRNSAVKLSSLFILYATWNIDREWSSEILLNLYNEDYRFAGFNYSNQILFSLYPEHSEIVLQVIRQCYESDDDHLIRVGAWCIAEMYIVHNEFGDVLENLENMSSLQAQEIMNMVINYYMKDKYRQLTKEIILKFKLSEINLEDSISRLFHNDAIDLNRDKDFLIEIMSSNIGRRTAYAFSRYLEEEAKSIIDFNEIIITIANNLIDGEYLEDYHTVLVDEIAKLIIGLYDEASNKVELNSVTDSCLNIWDKMFEKQLGGVRILSERFLE